MTDNKHNFEELTAPAATAKQLQISVATLRKYSLIVERITGKSDYYVRNKQKARLYSKQDVQDLDDFHQLAKNNGLTLEEAARQIFAVSDEPKTPARKAEAGQEDLVSSPEIVKVLDTLQQTISQQNAAIKDLQTQLSRIEEQNQDLLAKQKQLPEPDQTVDDFAGLPDISGIVTDEEDAVPTKTEEPEDRPLTIEEKRQQVKQDQTKSSAQLHEEILAKAKENAEKQEANSHRTLSDMQLEPKKEHWWQRFINI
ncbi:transcriptional regulator [Lactobacillus sp. ESL0684]|uniref:transcriptional regulator n=1 Tax=Lactobacillus sp. ESL0684 TaxID=2983213 RepID=UPI0023F8485F|nr:transcriptional regulator [Lactobacillus sp. ESL0684]WEV43527.1 transcriptional regulator [Lactobacillus sp. ESL0684]